MILHKQLVAVLLLILLSEAVSAQNNTNSPYTRYGYGQLADQTFGKSKAMGGIAYGLRDRYQINPSNPASYSAVDSLTFLYEGGITLQNTNFSDGTTKLNTKNSSFDYVAMQFRLHRKLGMTVGLLPFSNVGYNFSQVNTETPANTITYSGEGGLHQFFAGLGFQVTKNLSIGTNLSYLWGNITRNAVVIFASTASASSYQETRVVSLKDVKFDLGLQYTYDLGKKNSLTAGLVFSPKRKLTNEVYEQTVTGAVTIKDIKADFGIPLSWGLGVTYMYDTRLSVGLDYSLQKWSKVSYLGDANAFCDYSKIAGGIEYLPRYAGGGYFSYIKYRAGVYYSTPYYKIENVSAKEYGITGGIALPLPRTRSILNVSAQYIKVGGPTATMLDENQLRINVGLTFNERWFFKRQVD
ncbi:hypothetical protein EZS27_017685 [termite gut metagenome]|uniref:Outer membrane protein n=1 Tax=termite gut metagenome TaxID=433724 RepID=A0A5J4RKA0_9ZZZZ